MIKKKVIIYIENNLLLSPYQYYFVHAIIILYNIDNHHLSLEKY